MNMPARWRAVWVGLTVVLAVGLTASAAGPTLNIPREVAEGALQDSHRQQIDEYVAYQVDQIANATTAKVVTAARSRLIDSYNRYGTKAQEFMMAYAASMAKYGTAMLEKLSADDPLAALKSVNLSIAAARMGQVNLGPLAVAMVSYREAAVRYFGWQAYASMRVPVLATGGNPAGLMFTTLSTRLQQETDPYVLAEMMRMFVVRDLGQPGSPLPKETYTTAVERLFKVLEANWASLCRNVMAGDGTIAEAGFSATESAITMKNILEIGIADKNIAQMLGNMSWAAGKAYERSLNIQAAAAAATLAERADKQAEQDPSPLNIPAAKAADEKADALAKKVGMDRKTLANELMDRQAAVGSVAKLLQECENALNKLTKQSNRFINKALLDTGDRAAAVQLAVYKWIDALVSDYSITKPQDAVMAKKPSAK